MRFDLALIVHKKKKKVRLCISELLIFASAEEWNQLLKCFFKASEATRPPQTGYITTAITEGIMCLITSFYLKLNHTLSCEMADANIQKPLIPACVALWGVCCSHGDHNETERL